MNTLIARTEPEIGLEAVVCPDIESANPAEDQAKDHFKLREGCRFFEYDGSSDKEEFIVCTPENRQFRISRTAKDILEKLDGKTSLDDVARGLDDEATELPPPEFYDLFSKRYVALGIIEIPNIIADNKNNSLRVNKASASFFLHWNLVPERWVQGVARRLEFLYSTPVAILGVLFIIATHVLLYTRGPDSNTISSSGSLVVLVLCLLSIIWHEFGHAAALSKFGGAPGPIGFGLYVLLPTFFADVSEVWRFRRKQRMVVDLGGVYFQEIYFGVIALAGLYLSAAECYAVCHFIDLMVVINLNPIFRFDGYWFMVDCLGLSNLYRLAVSFIRQLVRKLFRRADENYSLPPMSRTAYVVFVVYALICNFFFIYIFWLSYLYLSNTFTRLPGLLFNILSSLVMAVRTYDVPLFLNRIIVLFFAIAFPATALLGIYKYVGALCRYIKTKMQIGKLSPAVANPVAQTSAEKGGAL